MRSSAGSQPRPRVVRLPRAVSVFLAVVVLPLGLAACGLLGGDSNAKVPVVIASTSDAAPPTDTASPTQESIAPAPAPETIESTVTKTGFLERTRTQVATKNFTATKNVTLPQITITNTVTDTKTVTQQVTGPATTVTVQGPGTTTTVTKFCPVGQPTC